MLQYLLCGLSEINVDDWRRNTHYVGYKETDNHVLWFWKVCTCVWGRVGCGWRGVVCVYVGWVWVEGCSVCVCGLGVGGGV